MKTPKRKTEKTTTNTERLLFFLCFMATVTEEKIGFFLRDGCMRQVMREEKEKGWKYRET